MNRNGIVFFGGYDPEYPRNSILRRGLAGKGVPVDQCVVDGKRKITTRYPALFARFIGRKNWNRILFVPDFRHKDVPLAWFLARMTGRKLVFDPLVSRYETRVLDRGDVVAGSVNAWHNRNIDRVSMNLADLVLADTEAHADFYYRNFGIDRKKIKTLYIGFDDTLFIKTILPRKTGMFKVLFYGSYLPLHGIDTIVRAAWLLIEKPVSFTLIGTGQTYPRVRRLAEGLPPGKIKFQGNIETVKLNDLIGEHHIVLGIFGTTPKTGMVIPNKVYQAMAAGRPVITADTRAIKEIFTDGEDIITVSAGNPKALAAGIERIRGDEYLRVKITAKGTDLVRRLYNPGKVAERFIRILRESGLTEEYL